MPGNALKNLLDEKRRAKQSGVIRLLFLILILGFIVSLVWGWSYQTVHSARQLAMAGQPERAGEYFKSATSFRWHAAKCFDGLAVCALLSQRPDRAEPFFRQALANHNGSVFDPLEVLKKLEEVGDYTSLLAYTDYLMQWWQDEKAIAFYRGYALNAQERVEEAEPLLKKAEKDPRFSKNAGRHLKYIGLKRKYNVAIHLFDREGTPIAGKYLDKDRMFTASESLTVPLGSKGRVGTIINGLSHKDLQNKVYVSLDMRIQEAAHRVLGDYDGAFVVVDPRSGAILACVSHNENPNSFRNRVFYETFHPASLAKLVTSAAGFRKSTVDVDAFFPYNCKGRFTPENGRALLDVRAHGKKTGTLEAAMALSCNPVFGEMALKIGAPSLKAEWRKFGLGSRTVVHPLRSVLLGKTKENVLTPEELVRMSVGLEHIKISPLTAVNIASAIANKGMVMKPYLIERKANLMDVGYFLAEPKVWLTVWEPEVAERLKKTMLAAVEHKQGTARGLALEGLSIAAKTGSYGLPLPGNRWIIGFTPAEDPQIAFAVLLEQSLGLRQRTLIPEMRRFLEELKEAGIIRSAEIPAESQTKHKTS